MSIVTERGDKGFTSLYCHGKVMKDNVVCEACGAVDELCSFLGLAKCFLGNKDICRIIETIQRDLFILGSEIARGKGSVSPRVKRIDRSRVSFLEKHIRRLEKKIHLKIKAFIVPGESRASSMLDVSRAFTRRLERKVVTLKRKKILKNAQIIVYVNRLSDLLFIAARLGAKKHTFV